MKTTIAAGSVALLAAVLTIPGAPAATAWKSLFDGKSFAGWDDPGKRVPAGDSWAIDDGALMSKAKPRIREDLFTTATFGSYELEWEWRIESGGNSGLKYGVQHSEFFDYSKVSSQEIQAQIIEQMEKKVSVRSKLAPDGKAKDYVIGFEYPMIDDVRHADAKVDGKHSTGSLYGMVAPSEALAKPAGEWNVSRVVYRGDRTEHWLNGKRVVAASLNDAAALKGLLERWGATHPVYRMLSERPKKRTPVVLTNHGNRAWFRKLRIREF